MKAYYNDIVNYYDDKVQRFGTGPYAVDWNSIEVQEIRFRQLAKVLPHKDNEEFTLCDFGCGLGAFSDYVKKEHSNYQYTGIDISSKMIDSARMEHEGKDYIAEFVCAHEITNEYDYVIESGIFNVRKDVPNEQWLNYITDTLDMFNRHAKKGFAFNCLTKYSDQEYMRDYLYYADPCFLFDYCKRKYSRNVALLHDYELYDFTIIVKKVSG